MAESVANPEKYWHNNIEGSLALLGAIRAAGTPRLIFSSTGSMYSGDGATAFDESAVVRPNNPYAATKATVDMMIAGECGASDLAAASLRYFNASGAVSSGGVHLAEIFVCVQMALLRIGDGNYPWARNAAIKAAAVLARFAGYRSSFDQASAVFDELGTALRELAIEIIDIHIVRRSRRADQSR